LGNPAHQTGWISEAAITLEFEANNMAICSATGQVYKLENNNVFREK